MNPSGSAASVPGLLGREPELARAVELIDLSRVGNGCVVLVEGPAGIGKTRLLAEMCRLGTDSEMWVLRARASELERDFAFGVVRQAVEPVLEGIERPELDLLLGGVVAPAGVVLGRGHPPDGDERPEAHAVLNGLFWLLARLAARRPLLLALDDVHWADEASLSLLSFVVPRVEGVPLLVAATARPRTQEPTDRQLGALAGTAGVTVLRPRALDDQAVAALAQEALGATPDREFTLACLAASGGNPFLVVELLRVLHERGVEPTARNAGRVGSVSPENVSRSVAARLAGLGGAATALARSVAVLGETPALSLAAELAGLDEPAAVDAAAALTRAGLFSSEDLLGFAHPLLRIAVASELSPVERTRLHASAARLLRTAGAGAERVALHLVETDAPAPRVLARLG